MGVALCGVSWNGRFDVGCLEWRRTLGLAEIIWLDADMHLDLQRHKSRRVHLQIVPGHAIALDKIANAYLERIIHEQAAETIHCEENCVPTTSPTKRCRGTLNAPIRLGNFGVVGFRHRAFLCPKRGRRALPNVLDCFRIDATLCRQRIAHERNRRQSRDNMRE